MRLINMKGYVVTLLDPKCPFCQKTMKEDSRKGAYYCICHISSLYEFSVKIKKNVGFFLYKKDKDGDEKECYQIHEKRAKNNKYSFQKPSPIDRAMLYLAHMAKVKNDTSDFILENELKRDRIFHDFTKEDLELYVKDFFKNKAEKKRKKKNKTALILESELEQELFSL